MRVDLDVVTMLGNQFVLLQRGGQARFPEGQLEEGVAPADAVRDLVKAWTGTEDPKLELVDLTVREGGLALVFRALLMDAPSADHELVDRPALPEDVGRLQGPAVVEALKTSLNYKLTRRG